MRHIHDITIEEVKALFKHSTLHDFTVTEVEKGDNCIYVYTEAGCEGHLVAELYADGYSNHCDFQPGFSMPMTTYIQWALWCGMLEVIEFSEEGSKEDE